MIGLYVMQKKRVDEKRVRICIVFAMKKKQKMSLPSSVSTNMSNVLEVDSIELAVTLKFK